MDQELQRPRVIDALRQRTRPMHEALERSITITDPHLTIDGYRSLLRRFYGLYRPIEAEIPAYRTPLPAGRGKIHLLHADLGRLGLAPADFDRIPLCQELPELRTLPQQLGCMYVLEGSTLGGQLIARHLDQRLALNASNGAAFFVSYGDRVGPMWRAFLNELEVAGDSDEAVASIVETAAATFDSFRRWLNTDAIADHDLNP